MATENKTVYKSKAFKLRSLNPFRWLFDILGIKGADLNWLIKPWSEYFFPPKAPTKRSIVSFDQNKPSGGTTITKKKDTRELPPEEAAFEASMSSTPILDNIQEDIETGTRKIADVLEPEEDEDATPKKYVDDRSFVSLSPENINGALVANGIELDPTEKCGFTYKLPTAVDARRKIKIAITLSSDTSDATAEMKLYVGTIVADNSTAITFDVENGTAFTFDSTNIDRPIVYEYTLSPTDYEDGDLIVIAVENDGGGAEKVIVYSCEIGYG